MLRDRFADTPRSTRAPLWLAALALLAHCDCEGAEPAPMDGDVGVCFYAEPDHGGISHCIGLTAYSTDVVGFPQLVARGATLGERVRSVRVTGGVAVTLFEGPFGRGTSATLTESARTLDGTFATSTGSFHVYDLNECADGSSRCRDEEVCTNEIGTYSCSPREACVYAGSQRTGSSVCVGYTEGPRDLPVELDRAASSLTVRGPALITLFAETGGRGESRTFTRDAELGGSTGFEDRARSFSVRSPGQDALPPRAACMATATRPPPASARIALERVYPVDFIATTGGAFSPTLPTRLYMAEKTGTVSFADPGSAAKTVALDLTAHTYDGLDAGVLNIAFSPSFATDGRLYVVYNRTCADAAPMAFNAACPGVQGFVSRLARFTSNDGGDTFPASTEEVILDSWNPVDNHTFGAIVFGADDMLYLAAGDGGNLCDACQASGQDLTSLRGKILRIDVTSPAVVGGVTQPGCVSSATARYCIPDDNPWSGNTDGYKEEIFAYGLRNPWRMSFDAQNRLWAGDVGQDTYEEVNLIEPGESYGWAVREGPACFEGTPEECAVTTHRGPVAYYDHSTGGNSITGGNVYRGSIPSLRGAYVFADFVSHRVWALWEDGPHGEPQDPVVRVAPGYAAEALFTTDELVNGASLFVPTFMEDASGELYIVVAGNEFGFNDSVGEIYKLVAPESISWGTFPRTLSATGCFGQNPWSGAYSVPSSELLPYELNAPFWSDGATKRRYVTVPASPSGTRLSADVAATDGDLDFPIGTVLVKEFDLDGRRIETRFMVLHADGTWGGYTYAWRDDQLDADLVPAGADTPIESVTWHFPTRGECLQCHGSAAGRALGPEARQLARSIAYAPGRRASELDTWAYLGLMPFLDARHMELARFPLDEGAGSVAHETRGPFADATVSGNVAWNATSIDGRATRALTFDGTTHVQTAVASGPERTLAAWINPSSSAAVPFIESVIDSDVPGVYGTGFGLNGGYVSVILDDEFWMTGVPITLGAWQHVALTFDDDLATLYMNGLAVATHGYDRGDVGMAPYVLGKSNANALYFHGQIADVRIFETALGAADVARVRSGESLLSGPFGSLPSPTDASTGSDTDRARAWLHTNCASCHRPGGNGQGGIDLRFDTPFAATMLCNTPPQYGRAGIDVTLDARLIVPGAPARSVLHARIATTDPAVRMPPISSHVVDAEGAALIERFIRSLAACP